MMELDVDSQVKPTEEAVIAELTAVGRPVMSKQGWDLNGTAADATGCPMQAWSVAELDPGLEAVPPIGRSNRSESGAWRSQVDSRAGVTRLADLPTVLEGWRSSD